MTQQILNFKNISEYFTHIDLISIIDVIIVIFIVWQILNLLSKSRALQIAKGLFFLYVLNIIGTIFKFNLTSELFTTLSTFLFLSLPIVFQREIRIALESFGRLDILQKDCGGSEYAIKEISNAIYSFSSKKVGALIILERSTPLDEYMVVGTKLDSEISSELLSCIFENQSSLHDGAIIIRDERIVSAKCILPLSDSLDTQSNFGTRHRAGIGITEISDSIAIIASEETGHISIANKGEIKVLKSNETLEDELIKIYSNKESKSSKLKNIFDRKWRWIKWAFSLKVQILEQ